MVQCINRCSVSQRCHIVAHLFNLAIDIFLAFLCIFKLFGAIVQGQLHSVTSCHGVTHGMHYGLWQLGLHLKGQKSFVMFGSNFIEKSLQHTFIHPYT
jgi:hypothetical protein